MANRLNTMSIKLKTQLIITDKRHNGKHTQTQWTTDETQCATKQKHNERKIKTQSIA
ncbi:hypothetical protein HanRHA438_Chr13g0585601 [Helianthus annuus]|nr:hypothetical protein HanRHA438_Chr13g0585601 [Helianthus annuus]